MIRILPPASPALLAPLALLAVVSPATGAPPPGGVLGSDAAACTASQGPAIQATIVGLKDRSGDLKLELYPAADGDFMKDDHDLIAEGKVFRRVRVAAPASGPITLCIRAPRPGRYALLFTHNRDGKNKFSIWSDGAGLPSNQKLGRAKPKAAQAAIEVGNAVTNVTIRAQYMRGLSGFGPLS